MLNKRNQIFFYSLLTTILLSACSSAPKLLVVDKNHLQSHKENTLDEQILRIKALEKNTQVLIQKITRLEKENEQLIADYPHKFSEADYFIFGSF